MMRGQQDQQSRVLCELSALVFNMLRSPTSFSDRSPIVPVPPSETVWRRSPEMTPTGFASLLLGISVALMVCGSVTFFIGFMLMPWVIGLVVVLYVAGVVSALSSVISISCATSRKGVPGLTFGRFGISSFTRKDFVLKFPWFMSIQNWKLL